MNGLAALRRLIPPLWLLLTLVAMAALHFWLPGARLLAAPWHWSGLPLVVGGFTVAAGGAKLFRRAGTPVRPFEQSTVLVTHGIYRYTRNPMYLGMLLLLVGTALMLGSASVWLPIPVFYWIIRYAYIGAEEKFLEKLFGAGYHAYTQRVRRWI